RRQIVEDYLYRTLGIPKPQQAQAEVPPWEMFADDTPPWELYGDETAEPEAPAEEQQRGDSFLEGITDPQQYLEFGKGILPGAVSFGGTVLQAPDVFGAAAQRNAAAFGRQQLEVMDRIDRGETVPETEDAL